MIIGGKASFSPGKIAELIEKGERDLHKQQVRDAYTAITDGGRSIEELDSLVTDDVLEEIAMNLEDLFKERFLNSTVHKCMESVHGAPRLRGRRDLFLVRFFCLPEKVRKEVKVCA